MLSVGRPALSGSASGNWWTAESLLTKRDRLDAHGIGGLGFAWHVKPMTIRSLVGLLQETTSLQTSEYRLVAPLGPGFAAISPAGNAAFVVPLEGLPPQAGRCVGSVQLSFADRTVFAFSGKTWERPSGAIECLDPSALHTFTTMLWDIASQLEDRVSATQVTDGLRRWDRMLTSGRALSKEQQAGLWGEISVLLDVHKLAIGTIDAALAAWRGPDGGTMDFLGGGIALEVKTSFAQRKHRMSLNQSAFSSTDVDCYLASIHIEEDPVEGRPLPTLVADLLRLATDAEAVRIQLLKAGYRAEDDGRYTSPLRRLGHPALFSLDDVPTVHGSDDGVSQVQYTVDLKNTSARDRDFYRIALERLTRATSST